DFETTPGSGKRFEPSTGTKNWRKGANIKGPTFSRMKNHSFFHAHRTSRCVGGFCIQEIECLSKFLLCKAPTTMRQLLHINETT
ncbi:unnamed protein product, partial [Larinioides sclopetarius]